MNEETAYHTGNDDDGHNVEIVIDGKHVVFACAFKEDAEELARLLNHCSWMEVRA